MTIVLPDATMPTSLNGGFASQHEFLDYVMEKHQDGN
jgi:hypothetical protein